MAFVTNKMVNSKRGGKRKVYLTKWKEGSRYRERSFSTLREARSFAAEMQATREGRKISGLEGTQLGSITYEELAGQYFDAIQYGRADQERLAKATVQDYRHTYENIILPFFSDLGGTIGSIQRSDILSFRDFAVRQPFPLRKARLAVRLAKTILKFGVTRGILSEVPGLDVKVKITRQEKISERVHRADSVYLPSQVELILASVDELAVAKSPVSPINWKLYRALIYFLVFTGVRVSEARGFPRSNFNLARRTVSIRQKADRDGTIGLTKSIDGVRDVPLHDRLVEPMVQAMACHDRDIVFSTPLGNPFLYSNLRNRVWTQVIDQANRIALAQGFDTVPKRGFHALRHSYASRLISAGANLKQLQTWMGHSDPAFTMRIYGHLFADDDSSIDIMNRF